MGSGKRCEGKLSCQASLYPLGVDEYKAIIIKAIDALSEVPGLTVEYGPMSTWFTGEEEAVFEGIRALARTAGQEGTFTLTLTLSNVCGL
ncbi:MAG TPA: hypothetical protein ENL15_02335 [Firmicutes bacterium]|nr:hypothetical protein [Bacillota bacterium]